MDRLFGTDGVRGLANIDLTPELTTALARAAAARIPQLDRRARFLIGRDTRVSGDLLEAAAVAGICSVGADALLGGVMPTPALAYLVRTLDLDGGIMISASHNTYEYNGLKFFGPGGHKLSENAEEQIEAAVGEPADPTRRACVGSVQRRPDMPASYLDSLCGAAGRPLEGMYIVADCAHGALHDLAPRALAALGADAVAINCSPNGRNINEGGVMKLQQLAAAVRQHRAHAGLAFDGDGDRLVLLDETGALIDGDQIVAIWANDLAARGQLPQNTVVGTVLTNGGLEAFLGTIGCRLFRTPVGDRYVSAEMRRTGAALGGETCGHTIFYPHLSSSDALYTGLALLRIAARSGKPLSELASVMKKRPQVSINIPADNHVDFQTYPPVHRAMEQAKTALGDRGWLLVRPSGTEPIIRITAECTDENLAWAVVETTASALRECMSDRRIPSADIAA
ncbi:MAG TPA: phosphoglucosamine mutase [Armatimonadota bacterium]|nr:phosphoglucosamine mutase [Armatimonadota bacterium]